jgi:GR25 family glycosyltransferase involved in LPS biosynthesis
MNPPNVFVISIRRLSHRIEIFKKNNPKISFDVIYGCDKEDLQNKSKIDSYAKNSKLNHSDIAAFISHRMAWQNMVDHHVEKAFFSRMMLFCQGMQKLYLRLLIFLISFNW